MKIGFQVVFFLILLNLVSSLAYGIGIAGTEFSYAITTAGDPEDYAERLDPEKFINQTQPSTWEYLPFLGNVVSMFLTFWNAFKFVVAGFPALLIEFGQMIPNAAARTVYTTICVVIAASQSFIVLAWLIQVFSGRRMQD